MFDQERTTKGAENYYIPKAAKQGGESWEKSKWKL
jgi:hypothetical protein